MGLLACLLLALFFSLLLSVQGSNLRNIPPAIYVFGDSTADVGNNNYLSDIEAKADYPHYGIDLPRSTPTGRFSNGLIGIDFMANHMGFRRSPPPYLSLANKTSHWILMGPRGANFASGASGILDSTGDTITMTKQISYFEKFKSHLTKQMGTIATELSLSKSIFIISSGGNDLFAFFAQNTTPNKTEKEQFIRTLVSTYKNHIKALHRLGGRKFALIDAAPIGCCPYSRTLSPSGDCIDVLNVLSMDFNKAVKSLMMSLRSTLPGMKFSIGSSNALISTVTNNPHYHGMDVEVKLACCGSGKLNAEVRCNQNSTYCADRHRYVFWDMLHGTHQTGKMAGLVFYSGSQRFAFPINLKQLVDL